MTPTFHSPPSEQRKIALVPDIKPALERSESASEIPTSVSRLVFQMSLVYL